MKGHLLTKTPEFRKYDVEILSPKKSYKIKQLFAVDFRPNDTLRSSLVLVLLYLSRYISGLKRQAIIPNHAIIALE